MALKANSHPRRTHWFRPARRRFALLLIIGISCTNESNPVRPLATQEVTHGATICANEIWRRDRIHVIAEELRIEGAILTIESGTLIRLAPDAAIMVGEQGGILARGEAQDSIRFEAREPLKGYWRYLRFTSTCRDSLCQLAYCQLQQGGQDAAFSAMVVIQGCAPRLQHCTIQKSQTNGVCVTASGQLREFNLNRLVYHRQAPLLIEPTAVASIPKNTILTPNGTNGVRILATGAIQENLYWPRLAVPIQIATDLVLDQTQLKLAPGVELNFEAGTRLTVTQNGSLVAQGTADSVIQFKGTTAQPGWWQGIQVTNTAVNPGAQFVHCVFADGGGDFARAANVYCENAAPTFDFCLFQNSLGYGLFCGAGSRPATFRSNKFHFNYQAPLRIPASAWSALQSMEFLNNSQNFIWVDGGTLTQRTEIQNLKLPYRLQGDFRILANLVTIEAGAIFEMTPQSRIWVSGGGALIADGQSPAQRIVFTGSQTYPGAWGMIYFGADSNFSLCQLNYCQIKYGGGDAMWPANVYCANASPKITNCEIAFSNYWGVIKTQNAQPDLRGTTFYGNHRGDIGP